MNFDTKETAILIAALDGLILQSARSIKKARDFNRNELAAVLERETKGVQDLRYKINNTKPGVT